MPRSASLYSLLSTTAAAGLGSAARIASGKAAAILDTPAGSTRSPVLPCLTPGAAELSSTVTGDAGRTGITHRLRFSTPNFEKTLVAANPALFRGYRQKRVADGLKLLIDSRSNIPLYSQPTYPGSCTGERAGLKFDTLGWYSSGNACLLTDK